MYKILTNKIIRDNNIIITTREYNVDLSRLVVTALDINNKIKEINNIILAKNRTWIILL